MIGNIIAFPTKQSPDAAPPVVSADIAAAEGGLLAYIAGGNLFMAFWKFCQLKKLYRGK